jgi:hypothetical protein
MPLILKFCANTKLLAEKSKTIVNKVESFFMVVFLVDSEKAG